MNNETIELELDKILKNIEWEINNYRYFEDGTEKLMQNIPAIDSLSKISSKIDRLKNNIGEER